MANETKIVITAATAQAESALRSLSGTVGGVTRSFAGLYSTAAGLTGALSIAGFAAFIKSGIDAADELASLSEKTGTTVEQLAGLKYAAEQNDTSLQAVADAAKKLGTNLADKPELFARFGITAKDTTGALIQVADIFAAMPDGVEKSALAVKLMGKSGEEMIPILNNGSAALQEQIAKGQQYNGITTESAKRAREFNDRVAELKTQIGGLSMSLGTDLLPAMNGIVEHGLKPFIGGIKMLAVDFAHNMEVFGLAIDYATSPSKWGQEGTDAFRARLKTLSKIAEEEKTAIVKEMEAAGSAPASAVKTKPRGTGRGLLEAMGGGGKKNKNLFDPEGDFWDQVDTARSKNQAKANDQAMRDYARSVEEANKIIFDIEPMAKMQAEWEKLIALKEQGLLTDEQVGKAYQKTFADISKSGDESFKSLEAAVRGWGSQFTDEMTRMVRTGKLNFSSLADSIINDLIRIQIQKSVTDPLLKAGTNFLSGFFGGGGGGGGYSSVADGALSFAGGGYTGSGSRSGGIDGMGGFPAILHPNETVIDHTLGQGVAAPSVVVNVVNQSGQNVNARQQGGAQFDGRNWVLGIVLDAADSDPNFRNAMGIGRA